MKEFQNAIQLVFTVVSGWLSELLGNDKLIIALVVFVVADYITGLIRAVIDKEFSAVGFKAICRDVLIFILVSIANILGEVCTGSIPLRAAVICFYISNKGASILENSFFAGLPIPKKLKAVLEQIHDRAETDHNKEDN